VFVGGWVGVGGGGGDAVAPCASLMSMSGVRVARQLPQMLQHRTASLHALDCRGGVWSVRWCQYVETEVRGNGMPDRALQCSQAWDGRARWCKRASHWWRQLLCIVFIYLCIYLWSVINSATNNVDTYIIIKSYPPLPRALVTQPMYQAPPPTPNKTHTGTHKNHTLALQQCAMPAVRSCLVPSPILLHCSAATPHRPWGSTLLAAPTRQP
jgi:hypothetical protein